MSFEDKKGLRLHSQERICDAYSQETKAYVEGTSEVYPHEATKKKGVEQGD